MRGERVYSDHLPTSRVFPYNLLACGRSRSFLYYLFPRLSWWKVGMYRARPTLVPNPAAQICRTTTQAMVEEEFCA